MARTARRATIVGEDLARHDRPRAVPQDNGSGGILNRDPALEEDLAMGEQDQAPDKGSGQKPGNAPEQLDEAREAAMMREILRRQERHREGGVEPELDQTGEEPRPEA
jgi:hypothetical protein